MASEVATNTCETCRTIFDNPRVHAEGAKEPYFWRKSLEEFKNAQVQGCPVCLRFEDRFKKFIYVLKECYPPGEPSSSDICLQMHYLPVDAGTLAVFPPSSNSSEDDEKPIDPMGWLTYRVLALEGDPVAYHVTSRPPMRHVASEESFQIARDWMSQCDQEHEECVKPGKQVLPTRVLDVTEDLASQLDTVRLIVNHNVAAPYAALTYCWGTSMTNMTTAENLNSRMRGFSPTGLPQTIQDAIITTRRLGLRYLWIDSLCIVQDDAEDKAKEISRMNDIFQSAYITISAANARNCGAGFLQSRPLTSGIGLPPLYLPYRAPNGELGTVGLYQFSDPRVRDPIHERAWTMQEHLLSSRLIVFGGQQMYWICRSKIDDVGSQSAFGKALLKYAWEGLHKVLSPSVEVIKKDDVTVKPDKVEELSSKWSNVMEEYSARALTYSTDKPLALFGIASVFHKEMQDDYLIGHWRGDLLFSLLWRRTKSGQADRLYISKSSNIPSWSWLSVHGAIKLDHHLGPSRIFRSTKVLEATVTPSSNYAPFGHINEATIKIGGHLTRAFLNFEKAEALPHDMPHVSALPVNVLLDDPVGLVNETRGAEKTFLLLPIMEYRDEMQEFDGWGAMAVKGLILDASPQGARRVGIFNCDRDPDAAPYMYKQPSLNKYRWVWRGEPDIVTLI